MKKVTFLGPVGATFSHDAYDILAELYGTPSAIVEGEGANCVPASKNEGVLELVLGHGGYGAIAMETFAKGRVTETLETFIDLLGSYKSTDACPLHVIAAIKMKIHFCLMARRQVSIGSVVKLVMHSKSQDPCKNHISSFGKPVEIVDSNGEAARLVAENDEHALCAALGPKSAAKKYGLHILDEAFEDGEAVTTFFLLGPKEHKVSVKKENRALIVFRLPDKPGSLYHSIEAFYREKLNMKRIHSVDINNCTCDFAIEVDVGESQLGAFEKAMRKFSNHVEEFITFGPFEVLER